ncbi:MAG: hypothetical protein H3C31_11200 [Brumimicrobium sp.]|nr:hypothetical protein [Brumimicrobium sp.]
MKKIIIILIIGLCTTSCFRYIGDLTIVSTRNIDSSIDYVPLKSYSGGSKNELRKTVGINLKEAVNNNLRTVPGGEYIMNAKFYIYRGKYYAVEGDVWGMKTKVSETGDEAVEYRGFRVGDKVLWRNPKMQYEECIVKSHVDAKKILIETASGKVIKVLIKSISKVD